MDERINILPFSGSNDTATAMAMMNNNPWMYLVMLALFGGSNWGNRGNNGILDMETQSKLNSLTSQINDNNNNQWAREAIQGNTFAISQLSQSLGVDYNALQGAINNVVMAVTNLGTQTGMGFAGVTNAINLGNLNLIQQLKDCCCNVKTQILQQGYEGRIETINQTNDLQTSQRIENSLTRTEIAAFRQAWEAKNYQDVVAEKTRLQTELDLLRTQNQNAALVLPISQELNNLKMQMANFMNAYSGKTTTTGN